MLEKLKNRTFEGVPPAKRALPWLAGAAVALAIYFGLISFADASSTLAGYVGLILGFNAYAYVTAGVARPLMQKDDPLYGLISDHEGAELARETHARNR